MAIITANAHAYGDVTQRVMTSPIGTAPPTTPLATGIPAGWYDVGWLDDATGLTQAASIQSTDKFGWQGSSLVRTVKSQAAQSFTFDALEENAVTYGLMRPASTQTTTGATAEVQTITISGTGTAGTWTATLPGYGTATGLAFNITTANLIIALQAAFGVTTTITGTAGSSYIVTFPTNLGNIAQMTATQSITGATGISVATTTPGVTGTTTWDVKPFTGMNLRQFAIYLTDGAVNKCYFVPNGEAIASGSPVYKGSDLTVYSFQVKCYVDGLGRFFQEISNNTAIAAGQFS